METCSGRSPVACAARRCRPGTSSPTDRLAVIQYIKYGSQSTAPNRRSLMLISTRSLPARPCTSDGPRLPLRTSSLTARSVWQSAKCWECHGNTGKGDGEKAAGLKDDFGFPSRPADLTNGQFKSGPAVGDIFRTMSTGLSGTPMPTYRNSSPEQDRWALAYYVLSLSAFKDPLQLESRCRSRPRIVWRSTIPSWRRAPRRRLFPGGGTKHRAAASGARWLPPPERA